MYTHTHILSRVGSSGCMYVLYTQYIESVTIDLKSAWHVLCLFSFSYFENTFVFFNVRYQYPSQAVRLSVCPLPAVRCPRVLIPVCNTRVVVHVIVSQRSV